MLASFPFGIRIASGSRRGFDFLQQAISRKHQFFKRYIGRQFRSRKDFQTRQADPCSICVRNKKTQHTSILLPCPHLTRTYIRIVSDSVLWKTTNTLKKVTFRLTTLKMKTKRAIMMTTKMKNLFKQDLCNLTSDFSYQDKQSQHN